MEFLIEDFMGTLAHKDIGYNIMEYLNIVFTESRLVNSKKNGCYQTLMISDGSSIDFTIWRNGEMPFYIVLYDTKGKYIFEMDLSMLIYSSEELFTWNLKKPQNKTTLPVIQKKFGNYSPLSKEYVEAVRAQKNELKSGSNTPNKGFKFLIQANWESLTEELSDLIVAVFDAHGMQVVKASNDEGEDDDDGFINQKRRSRKGQQKLKLKLLRLYNSKCAITGCSTTEVLEAAHILSHAQSRINHSNNGILLRSDIHKLFDHNLLRIEPDSLKVVISESLESTPYWKLNGKPVAKRTDGSTISKEYLKMRWDGEY